jgi:hypothetical protein
MSSPSLSSVGLLLRIARLLPPWGSHFHSSSLPKRINKSTLNASSFLFVAFGLGGLVACTNPSLKEEGPKEGVVIVTPREKNESKKGTLNGGGAEGFSAASQGLSKFRMVRVKNGIVGDAVELKAEDSTYLSTWALECTPDSAMAMSPPPWSVGWEFSSPTSVRFIGFLVGPDRLRFNVDEPYSMRAFSQDGERRLAYECQGADDGGKVWSVLTRVLGPTQVKEFGMGL